MDTSLLHSVGDALHTYGRDFVDGAGLALHSAHNAFYIILNPMRMLYLFAGVCMGLSLGILPGIGGIAGTALLLPFTYSLDPPTAFALLLVVGAAGDEVNRRPAAAHLVDGGEGLGRERRVGDVGPVREQELEGVRLAGDIGRADVVANEGAGLEQILAPGAEAADTEIGAAAGDREAGQRIARQAIVSANRNTERARGRIVRSERRIARRAAAAAIGRAPDTPALIEQRDIRLGREFGKGIARRARLLRGIAERTLFRERDSACIAAKAAIAACRERV